MFKEPKPATVDQMETISTSNQEDKVAITPDNSSSLPEPIREVMPESIDIADNNNSPDQITEVIPQDCGCSGGGHGSLGYVYAIGRIYPKFPNESVEKEYNYASNEFKANGPANALPYQVLSQGRNLYLAQMMCWILQIDGVDTYIVKPRSDVELYHLIAALAPVNVGEVKFDVIIGNRGPIAGPNECNGLQLPTVVCNLSYDFTFNQFTTAIKEQIKDVPEAIVNSMLQQMLKISDNAGETDAHRAINYLTIRSKDIYYMAWQMHLDEPTIPYPLGLYLLEAVDVKPSNVQGNRRIVDVIFTWISRDRVEKTYWYLKVDVTEQLPFMASKKLSKYYPAP